MIYDFNDKNKLNINKLTVVNIVKLEVKPPINKRKLNDNK